MFPLFRLQQYRAHVPRGNYSVRIERCLLLMGRMRLEVEALEQQTGRAMLTFAVIPEAHVDVCPIRIDNYIMAHLYKMQAGDANDEAIKEIAKRRAAWGDIIDLDRVERLRRSATFALSVQTDGAFASVLFQKAVVKTAQPRVQPTKRAKAATRRAATKPNGVLVSLDRPGLYTEDDHLDTTHTPDLVAVDPGVTRLITAVRLRDPDGKPFVVTQGAYKDGSGRDWVTKKTGVGSHYYRRKLAHVRECMSPVSATHMQQYPAYIAALGVCWNQWWAAKTPQKRRKDKFYAAGRRTSFMDKVRKSFFCADSH
jgi:hypothetical protein